MRRGRLSFLRLLRRRPALQGRRSPLRAARRQGLARTLGTHHDEPRLSRLEHRLSQRHLDRHAARQAHPSRRRDPHRGRQLPQTREPERGRRQAEKAVKRPADQEHVYLDAVLDTYISLPGTPPQPSRQDRRLALDLCRRGVPLRAVRTALLLAAARRNLRSGPPLPPVRTLYYFLPVIEEVLELPPDPGYAQYLAGKLQSLVAEKDRLRAGGTTSSHPRRQARQIPALPDRR
jgi:hypothetical protein